MANSVSSRPVGTFRNEPRERVSVWRTAYADEELQVPALPERSLKPLAAVPPEVQAELGSDPVALPSVVPVDPALSEAVSASSPER